MGPKGELRRGRVATSLLFACVGLVIGTWTARLPAIKHGLELTDGTLSLALMGFAVGNIIGMQLVGRLVDRYGSARVMVLGAVGDGVLLLTPALCPNLPTLVASMVAFGTVHGILNIAMNTNAVDLERAAGRPLMSSIHAAYSVGGFGGAALGGVCAYAGLSALTTFSIGGAIIVTTAVLARAWAYQAPSKAPEPETAAAAPGGLGAGVLLLGAIAFCCLVGEGAAADWSSVYLRDSLGTTAGFAAAAYAAFAIAMTGGRLVGDRLTIHFGPVRLVRASALLAAGGLGVALLIGTPVAGVIGFGCLGAGLSCIAPQVFSAAGRQYPQRASRALARVVSIGWLGFVIGPLLIGGLASVTSLPVGLTIPVALAVFVAGAATALRTPERSPKAVGSEQG